ncbi:hypothetical protein HDZ31DRAFT_45875, partial [Schizophyllum fasciatum]
RVNPVHADFPALPAEFSVSSGNHWHLGWPLSMPEARDLAQRRTTWTFKNRHPDEPWRSHFGMLRKICEMAMGSGWVFVHLFLVRPVGAVADPSYQTGVLLPDGCDRAVSFVAIMSTADEDLFESRPTPGMLRRLVQLFGRDPVWMEDVIEKKDWRQEPVVASDLQRINPVHADFPGLPAEFSESSGNHWHLGWPLSMPEARDLVHRYTPRAFEDRYPDEPWRLYNGILRRISQMARGTGWIFVHLFLVRPVGAVADPSYQTGVLLPDGCDRAVSFVAIMSTADEDLFESRPTPGMLRRLVQVFGRDPVWMEDVIEKKDWRQFYAADEMM